MHEGRGKERAVKLQKTFSHDLPNRIESFKKQLQETPRPTASAPNDNSSANGDESDVPTVPRPEFHDEDDIPSYDDEDSSSGSDTRGMFDGSDDDGEFDDSADATSDSDGGSSSSFEVVGGRPGTPTTDAAAERARRPSALSATSDPSEEGLRRGSCSSRGSDASSTLVCEYSLTRDASHASHDGQRRPSDEPHRPHHVSHARRPSGAAGVHPPEDGGPETAVFMPRVSAIRRIDAELMEVMRDAVGKLEHFVGDLRLGSDVTLTSMLRKLAQVNREIGAAAADDGLRFQTYFKFHDGEFTRAVKTGCPVILEDFDFPSQSVTERLNSVLEPDPSFSVSEDVTASDKVVFWNPPPPASSPSPPSLPPSPFPGPPGVPRPSARCVLPLPGPTAAPHETTRCTGRTTSFYVHRRAHQMREPRRIQRRAKRMSCDVLQRASDHAVRVG